MNFLQPLYKRSHYKCFFCRVPLKTALLSYRDYKTNLLTFRTMKSKIDVHIVFSLKYSPEKAINSSFRKALCT